jgi:EmrB/QacA subfamily drug resistance transporter
LNRSLITALIVASSLIMENIDGTVIATSLPLIAADLGTSPLSLKLAMTSYMLALAIFIPASGWVADRFGARNVFRIALVVFVVGSILSGLSQSLEQLVVSRVIQGIGGSMMTPVGRLIVLRSVPRERMIEAFTWLTFPAMIGPMIGPPLGGFITTYSSWRLIFFINVPIAILGVILATRFIPDVREEDPGVFDFKGFVLTALGFTGVVFGFSLAGGHFISAGPNILLILAGMFFIWLYVRHARHHPNPLLDLTLFKLDTFRRAIIGGTVFRLCMGAVPFLLPLMLQLGFGLSPFHSGMLTFVSSFGALFMKAASSLVLRTFGFRTTVLVNGFICAGTFAVNALFTPATPHAILLAVFLVGGFFRSLQFTALNGLVFADVEMSRMSKATGINATSLQIAGSGGIALGATIVELTQLSRGETGLSADVFGPTFLFLGVIMLLSSLIFWRLPPDAGEGLAGPARQRGMPKAAPQAAPEASAA